MGSLPPFFAGNNPIPSGRPPPPPAPQQADSYLRSRPESHSYGSRLPREDSAMSSFSLSDSDFDILEWHPKYLSCQRYFLDYAQHEPATQAVCALLNIRLPFQWLANPITSSQSQSQSSQAGSNFNFNAFARASNQGYNSPQRNGAEREANFASPIPYIRRLVVTGFDRAAILHGFFGDDYVKGIMPHVECERRNYLFAAKAGGWRSCKKQYDLGSGGGADETLPFMKPLEEAKMEELTAAEKAWSSWLAMEDWMVGPRAPEDEDNLATGRGGGHSRGGVGGLSTRDNRADGLPQNGFDAGLPDAT